LLAGYLSGEIIGEHIQIIYQFQHFDKANAIALGISANYLRHVIQKCLQYILSIATFEEYAISHI
jgi:hypothetical protein